MPHVPNAFPGTISGHPTAVITHSETTSELRRRERELQALLSERRAARQLELQHRVKALRRQFCHPRLTL